MRKIIGLICMIMVVTTLSACSEDSSNLDNMKNKENEEYMSITWQDREYVPFTGTNNSERGRQIGIVNGDKNDQVYEYKNHSTKDWIISFYKSGEMDTSMLMKEINVKNVPDNLKSEYEWNDRDNG